MSLENIRIGVVDIQLPVRSSNTMGSLVGITPVVCAVPDSDPLHNDANNNLSTSDTYTFLVALGGEDRENGGYTVGRASELTATVSIASDDEVLRISIDAGSLPANYDEAAFMAVFVKVNSASKYQLCKLAYVPDDGSDFVTVISHKPLRSAPKFTDTLLQSTTTDAKLGSRVAYGFTYETVEPTTNEIGEIYNISSVNVDPNNGPPFTVRTTAAAGLEFSLLLNDIKSIVRAAGGHTSSYSDPDGDTIVEGEFGLATAQAILRGNQPVKINYPPDGQGFSEVGLFLALRTQNDTNLRLAWSKSATTPVNITYEAAVLDSLLIGQHTKLSYLKRA